MALNLPSERIADPSDQGGLFGHWRRSANHHSVGDHSIAIKPVSNHERVDFNGFFVLR